MNGQVLDVQERKQELRGKIRAQRQGIEPGEREAWDHSIQNALLDSDLWRRADSVLIYRSLKEEVGTHGLLRHALREGKRLCMPRCDKAARRGFDVVEVSDLDRDLESWRMSEAVRLIQPKGNLAAWPEEARIDLIVVPGVAFTAKGERLGFGAGMYDSCLGARGDSATVGLAYQLQLVESLPTEPHDRRVRNLLTENGWILQEL